MCNEYNGWTNYETWVTKLWLDNDQGEYEYMLELAKQAADKFDLESQIKDYIEEFSPVENAGLYSDLFRAAIGNINFLEIAKAYLEEIEELKGNNQDG